MKKHAKTMVNLGLDSSLLSVHGQCLVHAGMTIKINLVANNLANPSWLTYRPSLHVKYSHSQSHCMIHNQSHLPRPRGKSRADVAAARPARTLECDHTANKGARAGNRHALLTKNICILVVCHDTFRTSRERHKWGMPVSTARASELAARAAILRHAVTVCASIRAFLFP